MPHVDVTLAVTVESALAVGGAPGGGLARDARGRLLLPGSHVKGRLRHACEQVARALGAPVCRPPRASTMCPHSASVTAPPCVVCALFGAPGWPSPLRWTDLHVAADGPGASVGAALATTVRSGLAVDRRRGVAAPGSRYLLETSAPMPADGLRFTAERAIRGDLAEPNRLHLLLAGCRLARGFGGGVTRGLGWSAVEASVRVDGELVAFDSSALAGLGAPPAAGIGG